MAAVLSLPTAIGLHARPQHSLKASQLARQAVVRPHLPLCSTVDHAAASTFIRHDVAPGISIESDGALLLLGNVAAGASLSAAGDIVVNGRLQGAAHAGKAGDQEARISALDMQGAQLRIAGVQWRGHQQVSVSGPHVAQVSTSGAEPQLELQPLLPTLESHNASSFRAWMRYHPAAAAAMFTGAYATVAGLALVVAPHSILGLLFQSARQLPQGWIRVGGLLFMVIGLQYLGTALGDWHSAQRTQQPQSDAPSVHAGLGRKESSSNTVVPPGSCQGGAAHAGSTSFYVSSVWSRLVLVAAFTALVALGQCEAGLLVLAAINAASAANMWRALQRQQQMPPTTTHSPRP